jgi:hypothetical protein
MHNRNGEWVIEKICERLKFEAGLCHDENIIRVLSNMDKYQVSQLVNLGYVVDWQNEKVR